MIATALDNLPAPPCARLLGWHLLDARPEEGWIRIGFDGKRDFCNPAGFVQGGILSAMLDDTMGPAVFAMTEGRLYTATISMTVNHWRGQSHATRQDRGLRGGAADGGGRHRAGNRHDQRTAGRDREGAALER